MSTKIDLPSGSESKYPQLKVSQDKLQYVLVESGNDISSLQFQYFYVKIQSTIRKHCVHTKKLLEILFRIFI